MGIARGVWAERLEGEDLSSSWVCPWADNTGVAYLRDRAQVRLRSKVRNSYSPPSVQIGDLDNSASAAASAAERKKREEEKKSRRIPIALGSPRPSSRARGTPGNVQPENAATKHALAGRHVHALPHPDGDRVPSFHLTRSILAKKVGQRRSLLHAANLEIIHIGRLPRVVRAQLVRAIGPGYDARWPQIGQHLGVVVPSARPLVQQSRSRPRGTRRTELQLDPHQPWPELGQTIERYFRARTRSKPPEIEPHQTDH